MRVRVLGPVELETGHGFRDDESPSVTPRSAKLRRLLAALVVHAGTVVSADRLADIVWGQDLPRNAEAALQNLVARLRKKLHGAPHAPAGSAAGEETTLLTRSPGYLLHLDRRALDANHFEDLLGYARQLLGAHPAGAATALDEALALWRGPAYAEFADDDFARPEAARLDELHATAGELRVEAALRLGQPAEALALLAPLLDAHPLREGPQAHLLLAQYRLGRQADALDAYRTYRRRLGDELGLDPSASLRRLQARILRQDPELGYDAADRDERDGVGAAAAHPARAAIPAPGGAAGGQTGWRGNLPSTLPDLFGRDRELAEVSELVLPGRVVTLTGAGGVGKTSLGLHAAVPMGGRFPDGLWTCELAAVSAAQAVPEAVATVLAVPPRQERDATDRLVDFLRSQRALLVMDNCEHVAGGVAPLADALHKSCPDVAILATSREPLRIDSERVYPVPPLDVPPESAPTRDIAASPAVALFAERATSASPQFSVTEANAATVARICRRLDGLPLALELAATRMASMSPDDLAERLTWRFQVLRAGLRTATDRHRTLRAMVDWSYHLLDADQRRVFEALSVFAGTFTLEAAEAVAASDRLAPADIAGVLAALVDRSMVLAHTTGPTGHYYLLETLRAYGRERLGTRGATSTACRAHAEYVVRFAEEAAARQYGPDHADWTGALSRQFDDLRAAHEWALRHDVGRAARLVVALSVYVEERMSAEAGRWAQRTLETAAAAGLASPLVARVHAVAASAALLAGDLELAARRVDDGLTLTGADGVAEGHLRYVQGQLAGFEGRLREAEGSCVQAIRAIPAGRLRWVAAQAEAARVMYAAYSGDVTTATALGQRLRTQTDREADPTAMAWARYALAEALLDVQPERARELLDQALRLAERVGERYLIGVVLVSAASSQARHGNPWQALSLYRDVIEHWRLAGSWVHQWTTIRNVVDLMVRLRWDEPASVLHGAVVSRTTGARVFGADEERLAAGRKVLSDRIGAEAFSAAASRGAGMTDDEVVAMARELLDRAPVRRPSARQGSSR